MDNYFSGAKTVGLQRLEPQLWDLLSPLVTFHWSFLRSHVANSAVIYQPANSVLRDYKKREKLFYCTGDRKYDPKIIKQVLGPSKESPVHRLPCVICYTCTLRLACTSGYRGLRVWALREIFLWFCEGWNWTCSKRNRFTQLFTKVLA